MSRTFTFLVMAVVTKIIRDTLSDLSLTKGFQKHISPWLFIGYLHSLHSMAGRAKHPAVKNRLQHHLLTLSVVVLLANSVDVEKHLE